MKKSLKLISTALLSSTLILPVLANSNSQSVQSTITVPLHVIPAAGSYKVGIDVSVAGGPPSQVTFDTGGVGLHIFASQVGNMNIRYTDQQVHSSFGSEQSGFTFDGVVAYAPVTIGGVTTPPIPILVIKNVRCHGASAHACPFEMNSGNPPMFGKFYGELGAGMRTEQHGKIVFTTPFRSLPGNYGSGYIIQNLNTNADGQLVLGLTSINTQGFNIVSLPQEGTYPDGKPYFNDKSLLVQYNIGNFNQTMRTAFDTGGDAQLNLFTDNREGLPMMRRGHHLKPGYPVNISLQNAFNWQFTTGRDMGVNLVYVGPGQRAKGNYVNTGLLFFLYNNVLYDFSGHLGFQSQN